MLASHIWPAGMHSLSCGLGSSDGAHHAPASTYLVEWSPAAIICNAIPPRDPNDDDDEDDQDEEHEDLGDEPAIVREPDDDE